jgi:hypothetical protein
MKSLVKGFSAAAAVAMALSMSAPAFAQGSIAGAVQHNGGNVYIGDGHQKAQISDYAFATASGNVGVNVASGNANQQSNAAFIGTNGMGTAVLSGAIQGNGGNLVLGSKWNKARINGSAFESASGNMGANVASGNGNQQANTLYVNTASTEGLAAGVSIQHNGGNSLLFDEHQRAEITDGAFNSATGNIGANVAAGNLNQQSNVAVVLTDTNLSDAGAGALQKNGGSCYIDNDGNHAQINGQAFQVATGNVGANVAAGNANQQSNALVINYNDTGATGAAVTGIP